VDLHGTFVGCDVAPEVWGPEHAIALAAIARAVKDLGSPRYGPAALAWLHDGAAAWLEPLGINQEQLLAAIASRPGPAELTLTPAQLAVLQAIADLGNAGERATSPAVDALIGRRAAAWYHMDALRTLGLVDWETAHLGARLTEQGRAALRSCCANRHYRKPDARGWSCPPASGNLSLSCRCPWGKHPCGKIATRGKSRAHAPVGGRSVVQLFAPP